MSRLIGLLPEEDYFCYWQHLKYLLFAIALAVKGKESKKKQEKKQKKSKKMLSRMDSSLEVISMSKQTKMLMAQCRWFSFPTDWHSIMGPFLK